MTDEQSDDVEYGTIDDLVASDETERIEFTHNGKKFWFDLNKDVTHTTLKQAIQSNLQPNSEPSFDLSGYHNDMLSEMIVDSSIDNIQSRTNILVNGMLAEVFEHFAEHIPDPFEGDVNEDELKN